MTEKKELSRKSKILKEPLYLDCPKEDFFLRTMPQNKSFKCFIKYYDEDKEKIEENKKIIFEGLKSGKEIRKSEYTKGKNIPKSEKHFSGWNILINGLLAIIPASFVIFILKELGISGAIITIGVLFGFIYLAGIARKNKKTSLKITLGIVLIFIIFLSTLSLIEKSSKTNDDFDNTFEDISFPSTNKNLFYVEQSGNLYRNTKYDFRIKFPEDWTQEIGDGSSILQKAVFDGNSVSVGVMEFPAEINKYDIEITIHDAVSESEYWEEIKNQYPNAIKLDSGFTKIDNHDAYFLEYKTPYQTLDVLINYHTKQYLVVNDNRMYMITTGASDEDYPKMERIFYKTVSTFVFE